MTVATSSCSGNALNRGMEVQAGIDNENEGAIRRSVA